MRGSPILRALVSLCLLLSLGWPLHRLLRADEGEVAAGSPAPEVKKPIHLQVSFTQPPATCRVLSLGEVVWSEEKPPETVERDLSLEFPKEGIDLDFRIDWPDGVRGAAKVVLTDPAGNFHTGFVWGTGKAAEVLTFP